MLKTPFEMSKLVRISLEVDLTHVKALRSSPRILNAPQASTCQILLAASQEHLCKRLNESRPGGLIAAVGDQEQGHCLVFCLKVSQ